MPRLCWEISVFDCSEQSNVLHCWKAGDGRWGGGGYHSIYSKLLLLLTCCWMIHLGWGLKGGGILNSNSTEQLWQLEYKWCHKETLFVLQSKDSVSLALKLHNSTLNGRALRVQRCVDPSKGDEQKGPKKKKSKISFSGCVYHTFFAVPLSSSFLLFLYCCSSSFFLCLCVYVCVSLLSCYVCLYLFGANIIFGYFQ